MKIEIDDATVQALAQDKLNRIRAGEVRRVDALGRTIPLGRGESQAAPGLIHSRGEQPFSVVKLVRAIAERDPSRAPLEFAISKKLEECGYPLGVGGVWMPLGGDFLYRMPGYEQQIDAVAKEFAQAFPLAGGVDPEEYAALQRRYGQKVMDSLDDTLGASLIPLPVRGEFLPMLRAAEIFSRAGALNIPLPPQGSVVFPRETGDVSFQWTGPSGTINESTPGTGQLSLSAKSAKALVKIPNELARFAAPVAEMFLRQSLVARAARTTDLAVLEGTGGTLEPLGLLRYPRSAHNAPTADKITLHNAATSGNDGDAFRPSDVLTMLALVEEAPDSDGASAWIMRPLMFNGIANARADAAVAGDGAGPFLFPVTRGAMGNAVEKALSGLPVLTSTTVSKTRAKGAGTTLTYILTGNFRRLIIARLGAMELALSEHAGFANDQIWLRAILRMDTAPTHAESFVLSDTLVIPT
jgi:HK97 family phage major capsid protein